MFSFFQSKTSKNVETTLESSEYRKLLVRITQLEAEVLALATANDIIRNKVLRKIQFKKEEETEKEDGFAGIPYG